MRYSSREHLLNPCRALVLALLALATAPALAYTGTPPLELYNFHRPITSGRWVAWGERTTGSNYGVLRVFDSVTHQFLEVNVLDTPNPDDFYPDTVLLSPATTYNPGITILGDTIYWSDRQPGATSGHQLRGRNLLDLVNGLSAPIIPIPSDSLSNDYRFPVASGSRLAWTAFNYTWTGQKTYTATAGIVRDLDTQTNQTLIQFTLPSYPIPDIDGPRAVWANYVGNNTDGYPIEPNPKGIYYQLLEPDPDVPGSTDPRLLYAFAPNEATMPPVISSQHVVWSDRFTDPTLPLGYVNKLMHYDLATDQVSVLVDDLGPIASINYALSGDILIYEVGRPLDPNDLTTLQRDIHVMELRTPEHRNAPFANSDLDESLPWVADGQISWYEREVTEEYIIQSIYWTHLAVPCDFNLDGVVNVQDINPFILALGDITAFQTRYAAAYALLYFIDPNADGVINVQDINPFIQALAYSSGSDSDASGVLSIAYANQPIAALVPEPALGALLLPSLVLLLRRLRSSP